MISICIIEDIPEIQKGLKSVIDQDARFMIQNCFITAEEAIKKLPYLKPDIVITDINLPHKSGIDCIKSVKSLIPATQFIMFTIYEDNETVFDALKAGANGYILKNTAPEKIIEAILEIYEGGSPMSPKIARKVLNSFAEKPEQEMDTLSFREKEVLELLSKGFLYKEVAEKMFITISTVKTHINHIYEKLQVHNKTEAINKFFSR